MMLQAALARRRLGQYVLQAAIADLHLHEPRDWAQIAALYAALGRLTGSTSRRPMPERRFLRRSTDHDGTGSISGTTTDDGTFPVTVVARNRTSPVAAQPLTITVSSG